MDIFDHMTLDQQHELIVGVLIIIQGLGWFLSDLHSRRMIRNGIHTHNEERGAHEHDSE